jgi:hypothetical protein
MHPSSSRAFQTHQEYDLKHPILTDFITTKQKKQNNFLPSYIFTTWLFSLSLYTQMQELF